MACDSTEQILMKQTGQDTETSIGVGAPGRPPACCPLKEQGAVAANDQIPCLRPIFLSMPRLCGRDAGSFMSTVVSQMPKHLSGKQMSSSTQTSSLYFVRKVLRTAARHDLQPMNATEQYILHCTPRRNQWRPKSEEEAALIQIKMEASRRRRTAPEERCYSYH